MSKYSGSSDQHIFCFLPSEGIDIVVLASYLKAFVDGTATIKPARHPKEYDKIGFTIGASSTLSREAVEDLLLDSRDWSKEQLTDDFQNGPYDYADSDTWESRKRNGASNWAARSKTAPLTSRRRGGRRDGWQYAIIPSATSTGYAESQDYSLLGQHRRLSDPACSETESAINHDGLFSWAGPSRLSSSSSATSISSKKTVSSVDAEIAREFRKDFVPVRLSTPSISGVFRKHAPTFAALAFIDNGSAANFMSEKLCNRIHAIPSKIEEDSAQYQGPSGEPLTVTGITRLQVCWNNKDCEAGAKIDFKVVVGLTFEVIITFEMAKKTQMDLAAGPHPHTAYSSTVAPISSTFLPIRKPEQRLEDEKAKGDKKKENEKKEAHRKRLLSPGPRSEPGAFMQLNLSDARPPQEVSNRNTVGVDRHAPNPTEGGNKSG